MLYARQGTNIFLHIEQLDKTFIKLKRIMYVYICIYILIQILEMH